MTEIEISKQLALAIGWTKIKCTDAVFVWAEGDYWRVFDYRDWAVAGPIAEKFDAFPMRSCVSGIWHSTFNGDDTNPYYADTPQKAIALVVINGVKK